MLSMEDNELMCRVGPGTPMGNLLRQYWLPACSPRSCRAGRPAAARAAARRGLRDRLPRQQRAGGRAGQTTARTAAPRSSSAAMRKRACAASITAGSST